METSSNMRVPTWEEERCSPVLTIRGKKQIPNKKTKENDTENKERVPTWEMRLANTTKEEEISMGPFAQN